ncbi:Exocyst complex component EXO84, partial [Termitomyces sp. T112]
LNAATYKAVGRVRFVILDDLVLVARRRRRKTGAGDASGSTVNEGKLVAERCWPLSEMLVLDTKDSPRMTNVFKIRHGKETHVYRTENAQDKKSLLSQLRHVAEELATKKRKEREGEHERRKSIWQAGGGDRSSSANMPEWMADVATSGGEIPGVDLGSDAKEKVEQDSRWAAEWADDLTVAIALRQWEKAVALVEEGKTKLSTTPPLAHKLPPLNALLTKSLLSSLSLPSIRKSTVVSLISYLLRLKAGPAARSTLLQMRTKVIKTHVRKIRFD